LNGKGGNAAGDAMLRKGGGTVMRKEGDATDNGVKKYTVIRRPL
jgi:hypothetical protein